MNSSIMTAATTMNQLQHKLNTITNNLVNASTPGFKSRDAKFSDLLVQQIDNQPVQRQEEGRLTPNGIRRGNGARISQTALNLIQGPLKKTDRSLDFALTGDNVFFTINARRGGQQTTEYTRKGSFYLTPVPGTDLLQLVTSEGFGVQGTQGNIYIPRNYKDIVMQQDGSLQVNMLDGTSVNAGRLEINQITRPQLLQSVGDQNFALPNLAQLNIAPGEVVQAVANPDIQQYTLEQSNVNMAKEMTDMMSTQRAYQFNARALTMGDQMSGLVNQMRS